MKCTSELSVLGDFSMKSDKLVMHPNDGYDLGLMQTDHPVRIFSNISLEEMTSGKAPFLQGKILLSNQCTSGVVQMNLQFWHKMGKPRRVKLFLEDNKVLVVPSAPEP
jgi:hypothetical protein